MHFTHTEDKNVRAVAVNPIHHNALERSTPSIEHDCLVWIPGQCQTVRTTVFVAVHTPTCVQSPTVAPQVGLHRAPHGPALVVVTALVDVHHVENVCLAQYKAIGVAGIGRCFLLGTEAMGMMRAYTFCCGNVLAASHQHTGSAMLHREHTRKKFCFNHTQLKIDGIDAHELTKNAILRSIIVCVNVLCMYNHMEACIMSRVSSVLSECVSIYYVE